MAHPSLDGGNGHRVDGRCCAWSVEPEPRLVLLLLTPRGLSWAEQIQQSCEAALAPVAQVGPRLSAWCGVARWWGHQVIHSPGNISKQLVTAHHLGVGTECEAGPCFSFVV